MVQALRQAVFAVFGQRRFPVGLRDRRNQQHVGGRAGQVEIFLCVLGQDGWRKRPEGLAQFGRTRTQPALLIAKNNINNIVNNPFDSDDWEDEFETESKPEIEGTVGDSGQAALGDLGLGIDFDLLDPNVVKFIKLRAQRFAKRVNKTTWERLRDSLQAGIEDGEHIISDPLCNRECGTQLEASAY